MLLFVLIALVAVSLRVHSKYSPGVSCQIAGDAVIACLSRIPRLRSRMRPSQSPCGVEFITVIVVPLLEVIPLRDVPLLA